jgi:hypothetical protein
MIRQLIAKKLIAQRKSRKSLCLQLTAYSYELIRGENHEDQS